MGAYSAAMVLNHVNIYILDDGDGWTVVDTGINTRPAREIWEALLSGPLAGKPVRRVLLTHHHPIMRDWSVGFRSGGRS